MPAQAGNGAVHASGATGRPAGRHRCRCGCRGAGGASGGADRGPVADLEPGAGRCGPSGDARRRVHRRGDGGGRGRGLPAFRHSAATDGLSGADPPQSSPTARLHRCCRTSISAGADLRFSVDGRLVKAFARRSEPRVSVHSSNGRLLVIKVAPRSWRCEINSNKSSAPDLLGGTKPNSSAARQRMPARSASRRLRRDPRRQGVRQQLDHRRDE